ncbi:hypothetical protein [Acidiphilium multivorum]|uniref:hypothetical protein n=1 Tax=Acidiphilium multivorum TaxID=62140 RepID=UPI0012B5C0A7|nr:hypothetical protein [Acidiphilium multivorum]MBS3025100.1 hypothetical protein [Acidiphilium multivorum]
MPELYRQFPNIQLTTGNATTNGNLSAKPFACQTTLSAGGMDEGNRWRAGILF